MDLSDEQNFDLSTGISDFCEALKVHSNYEELENGYKTNVVDWFTSMETAAAINNEIDETDERTARISKKLAAILNVDQEITCAESTSLIDTPELLHMRDAERVKIVDLQVESKVLEARIIQKREVLDTSTRLGELIHAVDRELKFLRIDIDKAKTYCEPLDHLLEKVTVLLEKLSSIELTITENSVELELKNIRESNKLLNDKDGARPPTPAISEDDSEWDLMIQDLNDRLGYEKMYEANLQQILDEFIDKFTIKSEVV